MVCSQVVRTPQIPYPFSTSWVRPAIRRSDPTPLFFQPFVPLPRTVRWVVGEGSRPYRSVSHPTIELSDWQSVRPSPPSWRLSANCPPQRINPVSTVPSNAPLMDEIQLLRQVARQHGNGTNGTNGRIESRCRRYGLDILSLSAGVSMAASFIQVCTVRTVGWLRSLLHIPRSIAPHTNGVAAIAIFFCQMVEASFISFSPRFRVEVFRSFSFRRWCAWFTYVWLVYVGFPSTRRSCPTRELDESSGTCRGLSAGPLVSPSVPPSSWLGFRFFFFPCLSFFVSFFQGRILFGTHGWVEEWDPFPRAPPPLLRT